MVQAKENSGLSHQKDSIEAEGDYLAAKSVGYELHSMLQDAEYSIEILCGTTPGQLEKLLVPFKSLPNIKNQVVINSPLQVVQNRPDIIAAEKNLLSAVALTQSALASQFPKISLSAFFGYQNSNFYPNQAIWNAGQSTIMPLLNFGRIRAQIDMQKANQEEAFLNYQKTILKALQDVELSFVQYKNNYLSHSKTKKLLANRKRSFHLSQELYKSSLISGVDLLDAEGELRNSEKDEIETSAKIITSVVNLYQALGYTPAVLI